ncbi:P-loop containing nucleoside triphosphate hydrolase protein, partial [Fimicolochytrium jonesii]|uniref:P-loop containing nucleoside triphosphate hydrolase protein n=1 Tax=Fimicolochytrium jonesii TaxID=1396493 RepID=UPI0022FE47F2
VEDVVLSSIPELATRLKLSAKDAKILLEEASKTICSLDGLCRTMLDVDSLRLPLLSTHDAVLDDLLHGGFHPGLTEIYGKSGSGKSQLALQLSAVAAAPVEHGGLGTGCLYIATEQPFPIGRFHEIIASRFPDLDSSIVLDRTHIIHIRDHETQHHILCHLLEPSVKRLGVRLVVIDSIAANIRGDEATAEWTAIERSRTLYEMGAALKKVAHEHQCVILCLNQVVDVFDNVRQGAKLGGGKGADSFLTVSGAVGAGNASDVRPSLGLAWSNMVNARVKLSRINRFPAHAEECNAVLDADTTRACVTRTFEICFAPNLPSRKCIYEVSERGIVGL